MKRLLATTTAFLLLVGGASSALAAQGVPDGGNAAVTQYEPTPPVTPEYKTPPPGQETEGEKRQKKPKNKNEPKNEVESEKGSGGNPGGGSGNGPGNGPGSGSSPESTTGPSSGSSGLPFTGFDLLAVFGVGVLLLLAGLAQAGRLPKLGRQHS